MAAGVCTVSEELPREGSHSENLPFSSSRPVSHIPEQERKSACGSDAGHVQSPLPPANPGLEKMGMDLIYLVARGRVPEAGIARTSPDTRGEHTESIEAAAMSSSSRPVVRPSGFKTVTGSDQTHVVQLLPQWPPAWCYYVILFARQLAFILRVLVIRNTRNTLLELALSCREPREWGLASTLFLHKEKMGERRDVGHPGLHWRLPTFAFDLPYDIEQRIAV